MHKILKNILHTDNPDINIKVDKDVVINKKIKKTLSMLENFNITYDYLYKYNLLTKDEHKFKKLKKVINDLRRQDEISFNESKQKIKKILKNYI